MFYAPVLNMGCKSLISAPTTNTVETAKLPKVTLEFNKTLKFYLKNDEYVNMQIKLT